MTSPEPRRNSESNLLYVKGQLVHKPVNVMEQPGADGL